MFNLKNKGCRTIYITISLYNHMVAAKDNSTRIETLRYKGKNRIF